MLIGRRKPLITKDYVYQTFYQILESLREEKATLNAQEAKLRKVASIENDTLLFEIANQFEEICSSEEVIKRHIPT